MKQFPKELNADVLDHPLAQIIGRINKRELAQGFENKGARQPHHGHVQSMPIRGHDRIIHSITHQNRPSRTQDPEEDR